MLSDYELDTAITNFMARKQKQFPDINLRKDSRADRMLRVLENRSGRMDKDQTSLRQDLRFV